jgi:Icc-related predicted phosphoesterase
MKIVYLTDIHDGLGGLKAVLTQVKADAYIFAGDIIYKAFFSEEKIIEFCSIQEEFYTLSKGEEITPYDYATRAIRNPTKHSSALIQKSNLYRELFQKAAKTMKEKYELIEGLIRKYANSPVYSVPGNYDIDLQYTALYERDLHRKSVEIGGVKISGYGGAPIATSGIPEKLSVKYHEYKKNGMLYSEPEDFFEEERPDIALLHNPAYGRLDKIPRYGNVGSEGIRRYTDEYEPSLVLSGHVHEDQGIIKVGSTVFLNPSNFGAVDSLEGFQEGGYYAEIFMEGSIVSSVSLWQMRDQMPTFIMDIDCSDNILKVTRYADHHSVTPESFVRQ